MHRKGRSPQRKLEISAPLQTVRHEAHLLVPPPRNPSRNAPPPSRQSSPPRPSLAFLSAEYERSAMTETPMIQSRSPSKPRRTLIKQQDNIDRVPRDVSLFGRVKGAIAQRLNNSGHQGPTRYHVSAGSSKSTLSDEPARAKLSEESIVESSPKLQRFFGTDTTSGPVASAHRRTKSVDTRSVQLLPSNIHHDVFDRFSAQSPLVSCSDSPKHRPQTMMASAGIPDSYDEFATWARDSIQAIGTHQTASTGLGITGVNNGARSGAVSRATSANTLVEQGVNPQMDQLDPAFDDFDFFMHHADLITVQSEPSRFSEQISGLRQHSNVMEFAEPPAWYRPSEPSPSPSRGPSRGPSRQGSNMDYEGSTAVDSQEEFHVTKEMVYGDEEDIPPLPGIPEINIKRASDVSKRSSAEAGLSPPTLRKCKKFCHDSPGSPAEASKRVSITDDNLATANIARRDCFQVERKRTSIEAESFSDLMVEIDTKRQHAGIEHDTSIPKKASKGKRKSLPTYFKPAYDPEPMPDTDGPVREALVTGELQHYHVPDVRPPPPSRSASDNLALWDEGRFARGVEYEVGESDVPNFDPEALMYDAFDDLYGEDELQVDHQPYAIGWAR